MAEVWPQAIGGRRHRHSAGEEHAGGGVPGVVEPGGWQGGSGPGLAPQLTETRGNHGLAARAVQHEVMVADRFLEQRT